MKLKNTSHWQEFQNKESLLFFSQRLDELVFNYTLDTYKHSCLNTPFLLIECLEVLEAVENEVLDKSSISYVVEELQWSIQKDLVVKSILGDEVKSYFLDLKNNKLDTIKVRFELLMTKLAPRKYLKRCKELIKSAILKDSKHELNYLSNTLVTTLINMGVSKLYIGKVLHKVFFGRAKVDSICSVDEFLNNVTPMNNDFSACYKLNSLFNNIPEPSKIFKVAEEDFEKVKEEFGIEDSFKDDEFPLFAVVRNISATDIFSAFEEGKKRLEKLANLYSLFHHKDSIEISEQAAIKEDKTERVEVLTVTDNPIKNGFDYPPQKAAVMLEDAIKNLMMTEDESFHKFDNVVDLHALTTKSDSYSSQLVNIWISLETLTPPNPKVSKISNIVNKLSPYLMVNYTARIFERIKADLFIWDRNKTVYLSKKVANKSLPKELKLAPLILLPEYENERNELYAELDYFPLLRYRLHQLHSIYSTPQKMLKALEQHKKKLTWQLRRIYRTRNMIVHAGQAPSYISTLVENGHDYLDQTLADVIRLNTRKECFTLEQSYAQMDIYYEQYLQKLKSLDAFDSDNIKLAFRPWSK